ncbi:flagellar biosynthesis protein FliQ [Sediminispirochaeta smaragdinae]|uniref:Flagellar biosynthetic protein FliQ n=1 Tax=Sediminispirochaeta smaragdinae (strain DSM 11293 / JCM 15392 / SEBR 4228) TaxID=573413 RepID=E1R5U1_SEDSS|nr:flagellar biosynthesis protein FliQ [Sediminispirochaeta smaragdinae]ADK80706.1 flagellar biosynthetic protein FliQ [Sediminispirochaeta smaragdinae DSM 11293]
MTLGFAIELIRSAVFQILVLSGPVLLIGVGVGLIISIFQATTSIQEQTLTFVPKIAAILLALAIFGPWMLQTLKTFTIDLFMVIPRIGG